MRETRRIFNERSEEIDLYYLHISESEDKCDPVLFKVLKANLLLMLYNIVEATISNAIDAIRTAIHNDKEADFDCLKNEIRVQIIKDLKKNISPENFSNSSKVISNDIIKLSFNRMSISGGNIDKDIISDLSKVYGFNINNSNYKETGHGQSLYSIKEKRNDLAHGTYSFSEVGQIYSSKDLETNKNQTFKYLEFILNNIDDYLLNRGYKTLEVA